MNSSLSVCYAYFLWHTLAFLFVCVKLWSVNKAQKITWIFAVWPYVPIAIYAQCLDAKKWQFYLFSHPLTKAQFEEGKELEIWEDIALLMMVLNMKQVVIHLNSIS